MSPPQFLEITPEEANSKVLSVLQNRLDGQVPRSALMKWIRTGQVRVDKKRTKPFDRVQPGQILRLPPQATLKSASSPGPPPALKLERIAETETLLVLAKPAGLPVQPGSKHGASLVRELAKAYPETPWPPQPVHRLDKDTSGIILVAKRADVFQIIQQAWQRGEVQKDYLAWLAPGDDVGPGWHTWRDRIEICHTDRGEKMCCTEGGKEAILHLRPLRRNSLGEILVAIQLETGRKHQIRVQSANRGLPVVGDRKYGQTSQKTGLMLHAWRLGYSEALWTHLPPWHGEYAVTAADVALV
ncbi:RluA family pseudouridine synthase [Desulfohalobium retbaense]|uniref:Pseudouridine synthase n=1 Tax=Desulfohalobium retbaense (strain ATCC 49708 / DSM 5692 / JCM 16813 / HR100) TaxID=485915 RepID=C8X5P4_DESRD|nr:RluA family pseudouridine synthase [Desulfohalobium retbaense]ACV69741.1 pseudouridine synthase [Desulfohalobium retbaense DSM 5692]